MNSNSFWFCPECKIEVDGRNVTNAELHESCGCPVFVVNTSNIPTTIEQLISDLEELEEYRKIGFTINHLVRIRELLDKL